MKEKETIIISLGGAIIVPDQVDVSFLKKFIETIKLYADNGYRFVIITGGGRLCRNYNEIASQLTNTSKDDLDWLGIATTRLNAELVRVAFGEYAYKNIIMDPDNIPLNDKPIILGGGWKPGNSSDLAAVHCAIGTSAKKVINLSNIDFVYEKDPREFPDAKHVISSNWQDFRALLPKEWQPGLSSPFDPIAALKAEEFKLEVVIMNGKNIDNLKNYLDGKDFVGTTIKELLINN
jgi:uridylate kinase